MLKDRHTIVRRRIVKFTNERSFNAICMNGKANAHTTMHTTIIRLKQRGDARACFVGRYDIALPVILQVFLKWNGTGNGCYKNL